MIKQILFDCGGVLTQMKFHHLMEEISGSRGIADAFIDRLWAPDSPWHRYDRGELNTQQVEKALKEYMPRECHAYLEVFVHRWLDALPPMPGMEELVNTLKKQGYPCYLLSNFPATFSEMPDRTPALRKMDGMVISSRIRLIKPDPAIFQYTLDTFGLKAEETLFVDDSPRNVDAAISCGLKGYLFTTPADFRTYLQENGILSKADLMKGQEEAMKRVFVRGDMETYANYRTALVESGMEPVFSFDLSIADTCDGLLLTGGYDIDPSRYGQENVACYNIDLLRDADEITLIHRFLELERPIFGICRGHQILNVALGGDMVQDVPGHSAIASGLDHVHPVTACHDFMKTIYGDRFTVNSAHHQVLGQLGQGLLATCRSEEGYIEGIIHENGRIIGVQFHPERIGFDKRRGDAVDGSLLFDAFRAILEKEKGGQS